MSPGFQGCEGSRCKHLYPACRPFSWVDTWGLACWVMCQVHRAWRFLPFLPAAVCGWIRWWPACSPLSVFLQRLLKSSARRSAIRLLALNSLGVLLVLRGPFIICVLCRFPRLRPDFALSSQYFGVADISSFDSIQ